MPCHTFGGVVDQWRFSNHSHPQQSEVGGGACGNCHGVDGIERRRADQYVVVADAGAPTDVPRGHLSYTAPNGAVNEIGYGGATTIGRIHCSTCHDFNPTNDPHVTGKYEPGQAPIRVPGGNGDVAFIEKTALPATTSTGQSVALRAGNLCVFCHKSRKDATFYITASNTVNNRWGPHNGPQADIYSAKGGYHFATQTYGSSRHATLSDGCVSCHMAPVAANGGVPDHTMKPSLAYCKTCHSEYTGTTFDVQSGQSVVKAALTELQATLDAAGLLTRSSGAPFAGLSPEERADGQFHLDAARSPGAALNAPTAGAVYNYLLVARGKDYGVHNPTYAKQLLWDSIRQVKGSDPSSMSARPN